MLSTFVTSFNTFFLTQKPALKWEKTPENTFLGNMIERCVSSKLSNFMRDPCVDEDFNVHFSCEAIAGVIDKPA